MLENKHVLVTGGANGIGMAIVLQALKHGAKVSFLDKDLRAIESLQQKSKATGFHCDVGDKRQIEEVIERVGLPIDVLINNAGIDLDFDLSSPDNALWNNVINTNLSGARYVTESVVPKMIQSEIKGSVIFITSVHTGLAFPGGAAYDASKHALVGLMRVLALEYGKYGIRFNAVAPGSIYPAGPTGKLSKEQAVELGKRIPLYRLGTPKDVANVVVFLASNMAEYINGAEIRVDGGLAIKSCLF